MKHCEKCGKELSAETIVCPDCGCAVNMSAVMQPQQTSAFETAKAAASDSWITNAVSGSILGLAVLPGFGVNIWAGAVCCLIAELTALIPKNRINGAFKKAGLTKNDKETMKDVMKHLKAQYSGLIVANVLAIIELILLVVLLAFR